MPLPQSLQPFADEAKKLIEQGKIGEVAFSGPTYQVMVGKEWAFLQFDAKGALKDSFCTCPTQEGGCSHLAAAFMTVEGSDGILLHHRFFRSFWKVLFQTYEKKFGSDPELITTEKKGEYVIADSIVVKGVSKEGKAYLKEILEERKEETEETSLKFSNLSEEEIIAFKEGRPSSELTFELSFWSDLAKWVLLGAKKGEISIEENREKLLSAINVSFDAARLHLPLEKGDLPDLVPYFSTLLLPLEVHGDQDIEKVVVDSERRSLKILQNRSNSVGEVVGVEVGPWVYVSKKGFYPKSAHQEFKEELFGQEAGEFLKASLPQLRAKIEPPVVEDPVEVSWSLWFDAGANLHIVPYLYQKGDLSKARAILFGDFAYVNGSLIRMAPREFEGEETVIVAQHVPSFIWEHKDWLSSRAGFHIHLKKVETRLGYEANEGGIVFSRTIGARSGLDFGFWVYIPDEGFFPKAKGADPFPIKHKLTIRALEVPSFLRKYQEELKLVPGFWMKRCPLSEKGVKIALTQKQQIVVSPIYRFNEEAKDRKHIFFDEFVYIEGKGFFETPSAMRLPEKYRDPFVVDDIVSFFSEEYPQIEHRILEMDASLSPFYPCTLVAKDVEKTDQAYELKLEFASKRGVLTLAEIWPEIHEKKRFVFTPKGRIDCTNEVFELFRALPLKAVDRRKNTLSISSLQLLKICTLIPMEFQKGKELIDRLLSFHVKEEPNLHGLQSTLRPYQEIGLKWLWFLWKEGLGGILADDMGLGKTHQAMALVAAAKNGGMEGKVLILCPLSVICHWEEKIAKFLPRAKTLTFHGAKRELVQDFDILITSFATYRNDQALLAKVPFSLAILDEMQAAKNTKSLLYKALKKMEAKVKFGLTGTPIENRLLELKALFDLTLPGYMPDEAEFKRMFVRPIEDEGSQAQKGVLSKFIKPFVLRRKKEDVLLELPEKIESVEHVPLSSEQQRLYNEALSLRRESIVNDLEKGSAPIPYLHIFSLLSSLKQICNHPAVYLKDPENYQKYASGKWDLFVELLSEALESGQKVVIFSQYLMMIDIIQAHLRQEGVSYAMIRGSTKERGREISRFNNDPDCRVFVGSLQAAGWGIDLTAASVVIHYDRWWNAAREDQATDRVHRIGQKRGVQVFKLVTRGTFEERIDRLIQEKGKLMEEVVSPDDHRFLKVFGKEEILELLSEVR